MRDALMFLTGLVIVPAGTVLVLAVIRVRRGGSGLSPGSEAARALGCECPRGSNLWGLREALRGSSVVVVGCPVFQHHPDARPGMYIKRG